MPENVDYAERHRLMIEYQLKIAPFLPTVRDLADVWGLYSPAPAHRTLKILEERGEVISSNGKYYAISAHEELEAWHDGCLA